MGMLAVSVVAAHSPHSSLHAVVRILDSGNLVDPEPGLEVSFGLVHRKTKVGKVHMLGRLLCYWCGLIAWDKTQHLQCP